MGVKSLYEYFYKLAYGDKGADKATLVNDCLDIADAEIKANKDARHTQNTDTDLDPTFKATLGGYSNVVKCADYDHPNDAITAISTDNKTLLVTESETCDVDVTVPKNVKVRFERGGKWTINTGVTVTFNGQLDAGLWQIFNCVGAGKVVLNSGSTPEAYPEWWGAKGDGVTDDAAIFNSVLTQLDSSQVKIMKLNNYSYKITDTLILYCGQSIIGNNHYPSGTSSALGTKIIFAPTSEKDLFDIYTDVDAYNYVFKVYLGGILLEGNTTGGVTYSRYAINSKAAHSIFENLGITKFQDGIYCNQTMTNKYSDIYISFCSHACVYVSASQNTTDTFDNVIMRESPWGAILTRAISFRFINCIFEALTTGGINVYKECMDIEVISGYCEAVPNSVAGDDYAMFYINHDGTTHSGGNINIVGGKWVGDSHGSFLDVDVTNNQSVISVTGAYAFTYTNGIKADSTNTYKNSIHLTGSFISATNKYVDTTGKLNYEEGDWTATLVCGTSGTITLDASYNTGAYTKIGRMVTVTGSFLVDSVDSPVGTLTLNTLPFTCGDANKFVASVSVFALGLETTAITALMGQITKNTTAMTLWRFAAGEVDLFAGDIKAATSIRISATYFTD